MDLPFCHDYKAKCLKMYDLFYLLSLSFYFLIEILDIIVRLLHKVFMAVSRNVPRTDGAYKRRPYSEALFVCFCDVVLSNMYGRYN